MDEITDTRTMPDASISSPPPEVAPANRGSLSPAWKSDTVEMWLLAKLLPFADQHKLGIPELTNEEFARLKADVDANGQLGWEAQQIAADILRATDLEHVAQEVELLGGAQCGLLGAKLLERLLPARREEKRDRDQDERAQVQAQSPRRSEPKEKSERGAVPLKRHA